MTSTNWAQLLKDSGNALEPVPDNTYDAVLTKSVAGFSSTSKTMFKVTFKIQGGPCANRNVWTNITVSPENPNAMAIFFTQMGALGLDAGFFNQNPADEQVAEAMMNRPARIEVGHRTYQGTVRNEVKKIMPAVGGNPMAGAAQVMGVPAPQVMQPAQPQPVAQPAAQQPVVQQPAPVVQAPEPVAQPAPQPVAQHIAQPVAAPQVAPVPEPIAQPAPQVAPAPQPIMQPAPQVVQAPVPEPQPVVADGPTIAAPPEVPF